MLIYETTQQPGLSMSLQSLPGNFSLDRSRNATAQVFEHLRDLIVTIAPRPSEKVAADLIHRVFDVTVECVTSQPSGADSAQDDFLFGLNLDEVGKEWMDQHEDGLLAFELVDVPAANVPMRDEDLGDRAGDLLNQITATLESWGE